MERMGFDGKWITMISACIRLVSYSILVNGQLCGLKILEILAAYEKGSGQKINKEKIHLFFSMLILVPRWKIEWSTFWSSNYSLIQKIHRSSFAGGERQETELHIHQRENLAQAVRLEREASLLSRAWTLNKGCGLGNANIYHKLLQIAKGPL